MKALVLYVVALTIMLSISLSAQPKHRMDGPGKRMAALNLTNEQQEKINSLKSKHQNEMIDLRAELEKERVKGKELQTDNINRKDFLSHVEKMNSIRNKISTARAEHRMDVYELLTPEQKKMWNDNNGQFRQGRNGMGMGNQGSRMDGRGFRRNCCN
ncbi:MAG TPA: Spy/CpxP family protein refolding chaperone [Ignavibacteriaceae bacterium]|nr:Spy/CpxP family protein refolding chaperone [Ignavibacteriaceae bacterium]